MSQAREARLQLVELVWGCGRRWLRLRGGGGAVYVEARHRDAGLGEAGSGGGVEGGGRGRRGNGVGVGRGWVGAVHVWVRVLPRGQARRGCGL